MTSTKLTKQQIISVFSVIALVIVIVLLIKIFPLVNKNITQLAPFTAPPYLTVPVPSLTNLEKIFGNARFQELNYLEALFAPIKVENKGRPNPFIPY